MFHRVRVVALAVSLAAVLMACGSDVLERRANPASGTAAASVVIDDMAFSPKTIEISVGDTMAWTWKDDAVHDVAFDDAVASPKQESGTWHWTFDRPGSYDYVCSLHPNMRGTVVVR